MAFEVPLQIACLACGEQRVVFGHRLGETGECPRCRYSGWTYAEDMDGTTKRSIMNALAARPPQAAEPDRSVIPLPVASCSWTERRVERRYGSRAS